MQFFTVDLKKEFPFLSSAQEPKLICYVNDASFRWAKDRKNPAILICPGGAYVMVCHDREGEPIAFHYLRAGFSAFSLLYSVAPEHYPAQLSEAAAAMLYIRRHAEEWHIDPDKIAINGYSAGGHLAASLGVFWNDPFLNDMMKTAGEEIRPSAMVLGYPVISADETIFHGGSIRNVSGTSDPNAPLFKKMSLETQVRGDTPPAFLWHTADDAGVPVQNSLVLAQALAKNKVPFELHVYPHGPHGLATGDDATNGPRHSENYYCRTWLDESVKFLTTLWFSSEKES